MHDFRLVSHVNFGESMRFVGVDFERCLRKAWVCLNVGHVLLAVGSQSRYCSVQPFVGNDDAAADVVFHAEKVVLLPVFFRIADVRVAVV